MTLTSLYLLSQRSRQVSAVQRDWDKPTKITFWLNNKNLICGGSLMKKSRLVGASCAVVFVLSSPTTNAAIINWSAGVAAVDS